MMGTDVRKFFEKDYLGSWNVEGSDLVLTITKCVQGELNSPGTSKKTKKPVVYFRETDKGLALNATNTKTIAGLYGYIVEEWPGKRIALFKSMTRSPAGGDDVECLRIRPKVPKESAAQGGEFSQAGPATTATRKDGPASADSTYITPDQVATIETRCLDNDIPVARLKTAAKVETLEQITAANFDRAMAWIDLAIDAHQHAA